MKKTLLEKFLGKNIDVTYYETTEDIERIVGILQEISDKDILVDYENGFILIGFDKIIKIELKNNQTKFIQKKVDSEELILSNKLGIKIYKGESDSTNNNLNNTLVNELDLEKLNKLTMNPLIKSKIIDLKKYNCPIFCWASLSKLQKYLEFGENIIFLDCASNKLYILEYIDHVLDENCEIQNAVDWKGRGFEKVVFMNNKKTIELSNKQKQQILNLTHATYSSAGFAGYKHDNIIYGKIVEELQKVISFK